MKATVSLKKALAVITAVCMLTVLAASFGTVTANADTTEVSLYSTEWTFCKYGINTRNIYVKTDSTSSDQAVTIRYNYLDEDWRDAEAEPFTTLSDGSKIWKASVTSYALDFAIKYEANGNVYWDNNNGQDYTRETIGCAPIAVKRGTPFYNNYNNRVTVELQNYAYEKEVVVRYTNDNWNSYTDVPMSYVSTNENGTENWVSNAVYMDDYNSFEFCVYYNVNGQTYWANNFNQNYDSTYRVYP